MTFGQNLKVSGAKEEHKPKLLSLDIFRWGRGLPRRGGGQKVRYVPRSKGSQTFWAGYPGILLGYPGGARKAREKNMFVFNFCPKYESDAKVTLKVTSFPCFFWNALLVSLARNPLHFRVFFPLFPRILGGSPGKKKSACAPLCCKNLCCTSRFCTGGGGAGGSKSKQMSKGP